MKATKCSFMYIFKPLVLYFMISVFMLTGVSCATKNSIVEPVQAQFFDVVEYTLSESFPDSAVISDDQIIMSFVEYTQEYEEASQRYMQDSNLMSEQAGPSGLDGNPIYPNSRLGIFDFEGNRLTDIDLDEVLAPTESRRIIVENPAGGFGVLSTYVDFYSFEVTYQLAYFTINGQHTKDITLIPGEYIQYIQSVCMTDNGRIYLTGWGADFVDKVYIFGESGNLVQIVEMEEAVTLPDLLAIDGEVYLHASILRENEYREALFKLDTGFVGMNEPTIIPEEYPIESSVFAYGNACFSYDGLGLFEYSLENNAVREIVKWSDTNMSISVVAARVFPEQRIMCVGFSRATGQTTLSVLTGTDVDPNLRKEEIVIAGLGLEEDGDVQSLVYRFNNSHKDYRITVRDYLDEIDEELSWEQTIPAIRQIILLDYVTGNSPDIYLDIDGNLSLIDYSNKDYLLNIGSFVDEAGDITEENYMMDVLLASQMDDEVYFLPTSFSVNGFLGLSENIQGKNAWTMAEFDTMASGLSEGVIVQSDFEKEELLDWALQSSIDEYVNFDTLDADFTSDNFIALLEWVNRYGVAQNEGIQSQSFANGTVALQFSYIDAFERIMMNYGKYGENAEYIGFPGENSPGLLFCPRYLFAISSQSNATDACWDLISDALSEEFQEAHFFYSNPVNRNAIEYRIDEDQTIMEESGFYSFSEEEYELVAAIYWEILERADEMFIKSGTIHAIVMEEAAAYFAGQKSASAVADLIQNRVQTMLDERL